MSAIIMMIPIIEIKGYLKEKIKDMGFWHIFCLLNQKSCVSNPLYVSSKSISKLFKQNWNKNIIIAPIIEKQIIVLKFFLSS